MSAAGHPPSTHPPPSSMAAHPSRHNVYGDTDSSRYPNIPSYPAYAPHQGGQSPYPPQPPPPPPSAHNHAAAGRGFRGPAGSGGGYARGPPAPGPDPGTVLVTAPKIEMQPWARNVWRWLVDNTTGVARVDLRRPTPPLPEQYDGNILFVRSRPAKQPGGRRFGRQQDSAAPAAGMQYGATPLYGNMYGNVYPAGQLPSQPLGVGPAVGGGIRPASFLTGARIKITRSFIIGGGGARSRGLGAAAAAGAADVADDPRDGPGEAPEGGRAPAFGVVGAAAEREGDAAADEEGEGPLTHQQQHRGPRQRRVLPGSWGEKPLLDIGVGLNLDMDQQQIQPVARIKVKDLVSIKAAPLGILKISRSIPLGPVALKVRYELPLAHADRFWEPPARLMVRLDNAVGSGVHLTADGIEFDEQVLRFGTAVSLRASAGLGFPRQLPLLEGEPLFRLNVHRLSLKSMW